VCFLSLTIDEDLYYGQFFALNPDGTMKWNAPFATDSWITASPAIGADGTIYFGTTGDGQLTNPEGPRLYALWDKGDRYELKWTFAADARISFAPVIDDRGVIYFGSSAKSHIAQPGKLYALEDCYGQTDCPNGWKYHWQEPTTYTFIDNDGLVKEEEKGWCMAASVSIGSDGTVYAPILKAGTPSSRQPFKSAPPVDGKILGITEQDGGPVLSYRYDLGEPMMLASPVIDAAGTVYLLSGHPGSPGHFWSFSPDLKNFSRLETEHVAVSSPAIGASGHIYFGTSYPKFENHDYDPIFYAAGRQEE
jgi:outer membrane protein assembly factor BamB